MPSSVRAMETAVAKAEVTGIAIATVTNSGHYGAAGYYAWLATRRDMIGLSFTNVDPGVAAPGCADRYWARTRWPTPCRRARNTR